MDKENLHDCGCGCNDESCGCGEHSHEHEHDCGCGCGEHESMIVDLEDENGNTVPCEVVDGFEYKNNEYAIVQHPDNGAVYLFKVVGEGEEGELVIPDDKEFEEVSAYYENMVESEHNQQ
ncbi:DUF1292 domain-containing protein [Clostridium scatologenes]|uniref:DUF1292 domain-containing protein n=1 Tax=Clostridium scatologenes TaxID=1548 RepID=A0A0E3K1X1_CLOSL|nr:DUF1292 domain-containing protein [Clostridium scatologenes]AKA70339.1 protein of unknown function DUF1292 [Clostridium scatologenes]